MLITYLTSSGKIGHSVSIVIDSECARNVGIRTAVQDIFISSSRALKSFNVSQTTFISSLV
jgi:hypothetical protein